MIRVYTSHLVDLSDLYHYHELINSLHLESRQISIDDLVLEVSFATSR